MHVYVQMSTCERYLSTSLIIYQHLYFSICVNHLWKLHDHPERQVFFKFPIFSYYMGTRSELDQCPSVKRFAVFITWLTINEWSR